VLNDGSAKQLASKDAHSSKVLSALIWQRGIFAKMLTCQFLMSCFNLILNMQQGPTIFFGGAKIIFPLKRKKNFGDE